VRVAHEAFITEWATAREYVVRNAEALKPAGWLRKGCGASNRYAKINRRDQQARRAESDAYAIIAAPMFSRLSRMPGLLSGIDLVDAKGLNRGYRAYLSIDLRGFIDARWPTRGV